MKFGIGVICPHAESKPAVENFQTVIEQVVTAKKADFNFVWSGHHVVMSKNHRFQPVPSIARIAADSGDMHLGYNMIMALRHPVEIAEQIATLDAITDGKIILGPIAGYHDEEFQAYGVPKSQRGERLVEGVEIIKRLWTEDEVTYDGRHYSIENVTINPKPVQKPWPPIWIGANKDEMVKRASELGDTWFIPPHDTRDTIERQLSLTKDPSGTGYGGVQPKIAETFVAESDEEAIATYKPYIEEYYEWYKQAGQHEAMEKPSAIDLNATGLERFLIGSPETVTEKIKELEDLGIDCLCFRMQQPGIPNDELLKSIRLIGKNVIPEIRENR